VLFGNLLFAGAEKAEVVQVEDKPCTRCGKSNQPEWVCGGFLFHLIGYFVIS